MTRSACPAAVDMGWCIFTLTEGDFTLVAWTNLHLETQLMSFAARTTWLPVLSVHVTNDVSILSVAHLPSMQLFGLLLLMALPTFGAFTATYRAGRV